MLRARGGIAALFVAVAAIAFAAGPLTASGSLRVKSRHHATAHAALASCGQAEEAAANFLYNQYSLVEGGEIHSYTLLSWWQGCHGPYENVKGKTQWATYPRVRYNVNGTTHNGQVNVDPYGTETFSSGLQ